MQTIDEYFKKIQQIISNSKIVASTNIEYTKVLENEGYIRGILTLADGSEVRLLEYTKISNGQAVTLRYRFQWQTAEELIARWNNAPHHPEVETFPHHKHVKDEAEPKPSTATNLMSILKEIEVETVSKNREIKAKGHMKKKSKRIITIRETSVQQAKKMIAEYLNQHQGLVYPSDIADHFSLELEPIFEAVKQLRAEGKVKEAE